MGKWRRLTGAAITRSIKVASLCSREREGFMLINIVAGLITAALLAAGGLVLRHRKHLGLLRTTLTSGRLRVSVAALLRIKDDDGYVLIHHPFRPSVYGPPGGVVKYTDEARGALDAVGFVEQRPAGREATMRGDLRGFVPARHGIGFLRWYDRCAGRESGPECLRRELREELSEAGHPELAPLADKLRFELIRAVVDGPRPTPGKQHRTMRSFEVYDPILDSPEAVELRRRMLELARDAAETEIVLARIADIEEGRREQFLISPQSAFLLGTRRIQEDLPALR
ncbi:SMODS-associated NUDIX domain-containing protein [Micromonospora profundi]